MQAATIRDASGRVIVALMTAGRSRATIKRHEAEFNAFAGFLEARGRALPTEADCLDFIAERSGCRLAGLREPTSSRRAQLARRPLILLMEALAGGVPLGHSGDSVPQGLPDSSGATGRRDLRASAVETHMARLERPVRP